MDFETWLARVESEIKSDGCGPAAWHPYYDANLSPTEAVLRSRLDDGVDAPEGSSEGGGDAP